MSVLKDGYDEHFALIIGINEYQNIANLEHAVYDAVSIKNILIDRFKYKENNVKVLINEEATQNNIMKEFCDLINKTNDNDSVLFFFAGHGDTYPANDGYKGFLIPYDGTQTNMSTLISWNRLTDESELIRAKHMFFVMDACYSGLALMRGNSSKRFLKDMVRRTARQVLTAGKSDQPVSDSGTQGKNSIFTEYLLKALGGEAKTKQGVICASSVMNYVYNKVANDHKSRQTPGCGTISGEGDFIFNFDEIIFENEKINTDNDILVEVNCESNNYNVSEQEEMIKEIKELLSEDKNYIKVTDLVNNELKIFLSKAKKYINYNNLNDNEEFGKFIDKCQKDADNILKIAILLAYYGGQKYFNLIKKILLKIFPEEFNIGNYFIIYLMYYSIIIAYIESQNIYSLKNLLEINIEKTIGFYDPYESKNLIISVYESICHYGDCFNVYFCEHKYKYPLNEYLYKQIQPIIEDFLYLGDDYAEKFISTEILISCFYAMNKYNENLDYVCGIGGRYLYQLNYGRKNIEKVPINKYIDDMKLYDRVSNKEDFVTKYNEFLSKSSF